MLRPGNGWDSAGRVDGALGPAVSGPGVAVQEIQTGFLPKLDVGSLGAPLASFGSEGGTYAFHAGSFGLLQGG